MEPPIRGSDVWLKEDIRCRLTAILITNASISRFRPDASSSDYDAGFNAGMVAVFIAFGIPVPDLWSGTLGES